MLVTLLIALALVFFVMRPLLRKVLTPEGPPLALPQSVELGSPEPRQASAVPAGVGERPPQQYEDDAPKPPRAPAWMNQARSIGEAQAETLKTVGELVDENPKQAALIVRDWLSNPA